jgi:hypothetical protein
MRIDEVEEIQDNSQENLNQEEDNFNNNDNNSNNSSLFQNQNFNHKFKDINEIEEYIENEMKKIEFKTDKHRELRNKFKVPI